MLHQYADIVVHYLEILLLVVIARRLQLLFNGHFQALERVQVRRGLVGHAAVLGQNHPAEVFEHVLVPVVDAVERGVTAFTEGVIHHRVMGRLAMVGFARMVAGHSQNYIISSHNINNRLK